MKRILRSLSVELILFGSVLSIMLLKLGGLFENTELPGWDTSSHFLTLHKMATEYLPQGHVSGYMLEWLGGMPLFDFYAPLYFIVTAGSWIITGGVVPLALWYRISIFLAIFSIVPSFWYFLKTFFNDKVARWGIPLSLLFIFYPKFNSIPGIGAGATIWVGLISGTIGVSLILLWLSFLEKLRQNPDSYRLVVWNSCIIAALILTHTLSFIAGIISAAIFCFLYFKEKQFIKKVILSFSLGIGLSAFWFIPFVAHLSLSSSSLGTIAINYKDTIVRLFPFNPQFLYDFESFPYFKFWALALLPLSILGTVKIFTQEKNKVVPILFIIWTTFLVRDYLPTLFPQIAIHYHRFIPFLFILVLATTAYALQYAWAGWISDGGKRRKVLCITLGILLLFQVVWLFDRGGNDFDPLLFSIYSFRYPLYWNWQSFEYQKVTTALMEELKGIPDTQRVYVDFPFGKSMVLAGSPHLFTSQIPLHNNQAVISGLYVESSPLAPFILPTVHALAHKNSMVWGDSRLQSVETFYKQKDEIHIERLKKFGVNYFATSEATTTRKLLTMTSTKPLVGIPPFTLFKLLNTTPLISTAPYTPGLYINADNKVPFRDLAMTIFAGQSTFNFPVIEKKISIEKLDKENTSLFSVIIVSGSKLSSEEINSLVALGHPLFILNPPPDISQKPPQKNVYLISQFETIPPGVEMYYPFGPASWAKFLQPLATVIKEYEVKGIKPIPIHEFTNQSIRFTNPTSTPVIINLGYSPYWQVQNCSDCVTHQVTPAQILVTGYGDITLQYKADTLKKVSIGLSWITTLGIIASLVIIKRKKQSKI